MMLACRPSENPYINIFTNYSLLSVVVMVLAVKVDWELDSAAVSHQFMVEMIVQLLALLLHHLQMVSSVLVMALVMLSTSPTTQTLQHLQSRLQHVIVTLVMLE